MMEKIISVETPNSSLVFMVDRDGFLLHRHFGERLDAPEAVAELFREDPSRFTTFEAPSVFGGYYTGEPSVAATHADGNMTTDLRFQSLEVQSLKKNIIETRIRLKDSAYPFFVTLVFRAYQDEDIIASSVRFENAEEGGVVLKRFASFDLVLREPEYWLTRFYGDWGVEMQMEEERLGHGLRMIDSKKGVRTSQQDNPVFLLALGESVREESGRVIGGALAWSGNHRICFEQDGRGILHLNAGMNPFESAYRLEAGESFQTPEFVFTFSAQGKGTVTRRFHRWARRHALRDGDRERPVVLNSWEGAYFDFSEESLVGMMDHAAQMSVELFVLDDGWFGNKYPRDDDAQGLGDWQVNERKLPRGLEYLIDRAEERGLKFGLWIEPEMVNPKSGLAEIHPDWIVQRPNRERLLWRNQLLLDLSNPAVQDFVFRTLDKILAEHPRIAYIKWDANRYVWNFGSPWLPKEKQSHWWIDCTRGLYSVYERLTEKHPQVVFQACSSGGGRVDFGALAYHHEFWPSDDTDALERIFIQWGTNHFYPAIATAAHVSAVPNHQTGRALPLKFRFDVAMTGRLGVELQPSDMAGEERDFARACISTYKRIRPIVQFGDLHRLAEPDRKGLAALMYVSPSRERAVLFLFVLGFRTREDFSVLKPRGLDPEAEYRVTEINREPGAGSCCPGEGKTFSGAFLMRHGLPVFADRPHQSVVLELSGLVP